jgi:hypothetical protein
MSVSPTQGNSILVDTPESVDGYQKALRAETTGSQLSGWIMDRVNNWEDARNRGYQRLWGEYWRLWRGTWNEVDKNRLSERSRLVMPALSQAIDQTVSEVEEAIFSKDEWFDAGEKAKLADEVTALLLRDQLLEDLDVVNARDQIMEAIQNGAIFGTAIVKVNVFTGTDQKPERDPNTFELKSTNKKRVFVSVEAIRPDEFIPDPVGKNIQQMLGCAHRIQRSMHHVLEKIEAGVYLKSALTQLGSTKRLKNSDSDLEDPQSINTSYESEQVDIVEWHGKVPAKYLLEFGGRGSRLDEILKADLKDIEESQGTGPLVEAIVTIANGSTLLRAQANPFTMTDRSIVAAQMEKVPGRFWGRGVAEKGYNPQKALDAESRARMDALGYISAPMLGIDSGRIPRGFRLEVKPGKVWTTQGNPSEVLQPVKIGDLNALTFEQTQEMERMVQMGTGAFDTATALKAQSQSGANGAGVNSALMGAFVKRSKRAIAALCRNLIAPTLQKVLWRYMQFDPQRYPADFDLQIKTTLGIVAREVEAGNMTQLLGMMPEEFHNAKLVIAKGIVEHTSLSNKAEVLKVIDATLNPSPEQQQAQQKQQQLQESAQHAELQQVMLQNQKTIAEIKNILTTAAMHTNEASMNAQRASQDWKRIEQSQREQDLFAEQNRIAFMRLEPERMKAEAALISARKKPAGRAAA